MITTELHPDEAGRRDPGRTAPTVLVVDDHPVNRQLVVILLGYRNLRTVEAADGVEALGIAHRVKPALIITDVLMPRMNGVELVRQLRADPELADIPVVFYTATYRVPDARRMATEFGVRYVLTKPAEPAAILAAVSDCLGLEGNPSQMERAAATVQGLRLAALTELTLSLTRELDVPALLRKFARSCQSMLAAASAGIAIDSGAGGPTAQYVVCHGDDPHDPDGPPDVAALAALAGPVRAARFIFPDLAPARLGLPAADPPPRSLLVAPAPLAPEGGRYAWLFLVNRLGAAGFSADDVGLASVLVNHLVVAYENARLLAETRAQAARLSREVTERVAAEERLRGFQAGLEERVRTRTAELQAANEELESFAYSISHDLRSPLRAIDGFSRILLEEYAAALPEDGQRYLQLSREAGQRMGRLIDDLLAFSRLGRQAVRKRTVHPADVARQVLDELHGEYADRAVEVVVGDLPPCQADPALLKAVYANLLANALKFTGKRAAARVEVGARIDAGGPVYYVRDNGAGFDMQFAGKLFGVFQRMHRAEEYEGTGVGLAIVRRIVHRHGGRVWADAAVDHGATFYFTLPAEGVAS